MSLLLPGSAFTFNLFLYDRSHFTSFRDLLLMHCTREITSIVVCLLHLSVSYVRTGTTVTLFILAFLEPVQSERMNSLHSFICLFIHSFVHSLIFLLYTKISVSYGDYDSEKTLCLPLKMLSLMGNTFKYVRMYIVMCYIWQECVHTG